MTGAISCDPWKEGICKLSLLKRMDRKFLCKLLPIRKIALLNFMRWKAANFPGRKGASLCLNLKSAGSAWKRGIARGQTDSRRMRRRMKLRRKKRMVKERKKRKSRKREWRRSKEI